MLNTQTNTHTYCLASRNYYQQLVLIAVSATLLKIQAIIQVVKYRRINFCDQSVQPYINNINTIYWVGTKFDYTMVIQ